MSIEAKAGERVFHRKTVGEFSDGSPVTVPVALIQGKNDGPTLYVQAGIHGDEFTGVDVAWRLIQGINPAELSGRLIVVPIANSPAFLTRARGFLMEERFIQDANRLFPGSKTGLLTERIAASLFEDFVLKSDFTVDLHCALDGAEIATMVHVGPDTNEDGHLNTREKYSRAFGAPYLYYRRADAKLGTSDMTRSLPTQAGRAGVALIMAEMGTSRSIDRSASDEGVLGIRRIMHAMEMLKLDQALATVNPGRKFTEIHVVHGNRGGGVRLSKPLGSDVDEGEDLGEIVDAFGSVVERIRATKSGFVLRRVTFGAIASGAEVVWIGA